MPESLRPENIPEKIASFNRFVFNNKANLVVKTELEQQISSIEERISKISSTVLLDGMPVISFILQNSHSKKELKQLAKAIDRVADLVEIADQLDVKMKIIDAAEKDPSWFALTFGDFDKEIDEDIEHIFK
jgi:predicted regulator of amino acid metabolism with ACT domain